MIIGIAISISMMQGSGGVAPFATTQWQLITQQWQTITTTWN